MGPGQTGLVGGVLAHLKDLPSQAILRCILGLYVFNINSFDMNRNVWLRATLNDSKDELLEETCFSKTTKYKI